MDNSSDIPHMSHHMAGYLLTDKCYESLVLQLKYYDVPCLLLLFSKILGYAIIVVTSTFMKMPQIFKILKGRSADGVSFWSQFLMLLTSSFSVLYAVARDYHFSLWGESISLAIQTLVITLLILNYQGQSIHALVFTVIYVVTMVTMLSPSIPLSVIVLFQASAMPLGCLSKVIQIVANYRNGGTGQLSLLYIFLTNFRSMGRFTTMLLETKDYLRICDFGLKSGLNVIQLIQILYYNRKKGRVKECNNNKKEN